jgi:hypothetical protein
MKAMKSDGWDIDIPSVLKQPEGRVGISTAMGGAIMGVCLAVLSYNLAPPKSILGRMFDLHRPEVFVPVSIVAVFFWGGFLCFYRSRRTRACEKVSSGELLATASRA